MEGAENTTFIVVFIAEKRSRRHYFGILYYMSFIFSPKKKINF